MKTSGAEADPDSGPKESQTPKKNLETDLDDQNDTHIQDPNQSQSSNRRKGLRRQWISSLIASFSYFIIGTSLGWPSPVLGHLQVNHGPVNLTHLETALMVSLFYVGNVVVPIPCGLLSDWVGRKASLLYLSILPFASWILIWIALPKVLLHIGRFLMGMYSGLALTVLPLYLGEIAEPQVRGKLLSILQLFTNAGLVFAYIVGKYVSYGTLAIILGILPAVHFCLMFLIPESPYWYTFKGKDQKAAKGIAWLRGGKIGNENIDQEVSMVLDAVHSDIRKPKNFMMLFMTKCYRRALIIVEVVSASQRLSGISSLMSYISITVPVWEEVGLTADVCAIVTGLSNIIGVLIALPLVDRLGRIPLLKFSCTGCGIAMLSAAVWYFINRESFNDGALRWMPLTFFCIYGISMNIGIGPIPALMQGELFPSHLKARASAITVMVLAASSSIVNFSYIPIAHSAGMWCNFFIYTLTCVACLIFTWTYAFETKGKTLPEIQKHLTG